MGFGMSFRVAPGVRVWTSTSGRSRRRRATGSRRGGLGTLILVLIAIFVIVKFFWWIVGIIAMVVLFYAMRWLLTENRKRRDAIARYNAAITARADQQHEWVTQGDDRGMYGPEGAPLMHYIEQGGGEQPQDMQPFTSRTAAEAERQRRAAEQLRLKRQRAEAEAERQRQAAAAEAERQRLKAHAGIRAVWRQAAEEEGLWQAAAAEAERRQAWQLSRWPEGTTLDSRIAQIPGIVPQVAAQNRKIESQVQRLNDLLHDGLRNPPQAEPTALYHAGDPKGITEYIELTLTAMHLGTDSPKARVTYSPQSRQLVVEYELPTVDVVPKAKSYRYVKSQDRVVETARPASQVKGLYASAIAQLTLLCLAWIFRVDANKHIDVVVFNGVVDTISLRTGKPTRPCLITLRTTRDTFSEIDLAQVDPVACLRYLNAGISRSPTDLAPVRPVLEF